MPGFQRASSIAAAVLALAAAGCPASYDLPRTAAEIPTDRALLVGVVPHDGKEFWYVRLERAGAEIEIGVARARNGVFVWSLPPGEYRITGMRRALLDPAGRGPTGTDVAAESVFVAEGTPWVEVLPGNVYCVGTLAADVDRHRAMFGSMKGGVYYDGTCDFGFLPEADRPDRRWASLPWASLPLRPFPITTPK